jgi:hypothetical protein
MVEVPKEKQTELEAKTTALVAQAKGFEITDDATYARAINGIDKAKAYQAEIHSVWDPVCKATNEAWKLSTAGRKTQLAPAIEAEGLLKKLCDNYARKQADKARKEAARIAKIEADKKAAEAEKLAEEGDTEKAEAVLEEAVAIESAPVPTPPQVTPKGIVYVDNWKAVINNPAAVPREYCIPDQAALNKLAKANKGKDAPAGVEFVNNRTIRR